jgi:DNA-binding NarL/FixJ family response regulator
MIYTGTGQLRRTTHNQSQQAFSSSSPKPQVINVVIADHQPVYRAGIAKLLASEDDMRIIAQPLSADHLMNALDRLRPHVLVISSGFVNEPETLRRITGVAGERQIAILVLTENNEPSPKFVPWGAQGVFYRSIKGSMLVTGVRQLSQGGRFLQMHAAAELTADLVGERVTSQLSRRELKIISAVVQGYKNSEIASEMGMTVPLIKRMIRGIFDKTGVSGRLELALFVVHHQVLAQAAAEQRLVPDVSGGPRPLKKALRVAAAGSSSLPKITGFITPPRPA